MEIQHRSGNLKGIFFIEGNGKRLGEMIYSLAGDDTMVIEHTEVAEELKGKQVGKQLIAAGVSHARLHHYHILPLCPFAKVIMSRDATYADVLIH